MKTIYFVRHCEYSNPRNILPGRLPVPLSDQGLEQAGKLADYFQDKSIEKIYSSQVLRCQQTAETIANGIIPIEYDQRLLETFSAYQGLWFDDGQDLDWSHFFTHRNELGGENFADIQRRVVDFFEEVVTTSLEKIVVCSHGDPLYLLFAHLQKVPLPNELITATEADGYQPKASIRALEFQDKHTYTFGELIKV